jgi:hypothetical protein
MTMPATGLECSGNADQYGRTGAALTVALSEEMWQLNVAIYQWKKKSTIYDDVCSAAVFALWYWNSCFLAVRLKTWNPWIVFPALPRASVIQARTSDP